MRTIVALGRHCAICGGRRLGWQEDDFDLSTIFEPYLPERLEEVGRASPSESAAFPPQEKVS